MKTTLIFFFVFTGLKVVAQTCPQTGTVNIPASGLNSSSLPFASYTGVNIVVNGTFTIDNNFTTTNCTYYIADNVSIVVANSSSANFKLIGSKLFSCGTVMWNGITVESQGTLDMSGTTIEDAKTGILAKNVNGQVKAITSTFNKNYVHFKAENANGNNIELHSNTFTCEDLLNPYSNYGNTLESPYLNQQTEISVYGITTSGTFNIGSPSFAINNFYFCKYGIRIDDCPTVVIRHNHFEDITKNTSYPFNPPYPYYPAYSAIVAFGFNQGQTITIGGSGTNHKNTVHRCNIGFDINDYKTVDISYNQFTNDVISPAPPLTGPGSSAISVNILYRKGNTNVSVTNNVIEHFDTGIGYYFADQTTINNDVVNITDNDIERVSIQKGINGIVAKGNLTNGSSSGTNTFNISFNRAWELNKGIHIINTSGRFAYAETNNIKTGFLSGNVAHGIYEQNNSYATFYDNRVWGVGYALAQKPYIGLRTYLSDNTAWLCNKVISTGRSMLFEGLSPSIVIGNVFNNSYDAFTMGTNAVIGPQGSTTQASDNRWQNTHTNSRTFTINTNCNSHSKLYLRSGAQYFPPVGTNWSSAGLNEEYSSSFGGLNLVSNPGSVYDCPLIIPMMMAPLLETIVKNEISYNQFETSSQWIAEQYVWEQIRKDSSLLSNPVLDSFALVANTSSYSMLHDMGASADDLTGLTALSSSFTATALPEQNYVDFYTLYAAYYGNYQLTQEEYEHLISIADQCPLEGGKAVFEARALRDYIDKQYYFYEDLCEENNQKSFFKNEETKQNEFSVYPNPSTGNFTVHNQSIVDGIFKMIDITGKEIYSIEIQSNQKIQLAIENMSNGIYSFIVLFDNGIIRNGKLTIIE